MPLHKAFKLSMAQWLDIVAAIGPLLRARLRYGSQTAPDLIRELQAANTPSQQELAPAEEARLRRLGAGLRRAARIVPWRADCMIQVLAAERTLRRRGLEPAFYLGVSKDETQGFGAHVWLECGGVVVTGGDVAGQSVLIAPGDQLGGKE